MGRSYWGDEKGFVSDMIEFIRSRQGVIYVAASWAEADRLAKEMAFGVMVEDPFFRPL